MSWVKPAPGPITSAFGRRKSPGGIGSINHEGTDIGSPHGSLCVASAAGRVTFAGINGGWGARVVIDHGGGHTTSYAHLSHIGVRVGQQVAQSQPVGATGGRIGAWGAGRTTGPHCHAEHRIWGVPVNPAPYWTVWVAPAWTEIDVIDELLKEDEEDEMNGYVMFKGSGDTIWLLRASDGHYRELKLGEFQALKSAGVELVALTDDAARTIHGGAHPWS